MVKPLLGLALMLGLAACASPVGPGGAGVKATAVPSGLPLGCIPDPRTRKCDAFGTRYSGDDLRGTGAQHVGHALNMVDPELTH